MRRVSIIVVVVLLIAGGAAAYVHYSHSSAILPVVSHDPDHATEYLSWPRQPLSLSEAAKFQGTPLAPQAQQSLSREEQVLQTLAADSAILNDLKTANASDQNLTINDVTLLDDEWYAAATGASIDPAIAQASTQWDSSHQNPALPSISSFMLEKRDSPASQFLQHVLDQNPVFNEIMLTDALSLTVGITASTTDYYQGDEAWWANAFNDGTGAVAQTPVQVDSTSHDGIIKISVPVLDPATRAAIGVLTGEVNLTKLTNSI